MFTKNAQNLEIKNKNQTFFGRLDLFEHFFWQKLFNFLLI